MSALPVETAMSGMLVLVSPAGTVDGKVSFWPLATAGVSLQDVVVTMICFRHLPTWMTSGTLPTGALRSLKLPSTPVAVCTTIPLLKSAPHVHASLPVGTPAGRACSGPPGT